MDCVSAGITSAATQLGSTEQHFQSAAEAILTTDQAAKTIHGSLEADGVTVKIAAMAKGAGMIGPNMATMLGIITTDAHLPPATAQTVLQHAVDQSFNRISVEGHTSTNDAVILLASGTTSKKPLCGTALSDFQTELTHLCIELAKKIPIDGEGART